MDEGVRGWLQTVWNKRPGALLKKRSILIWDMFRAYLTENVKNEASALKTDLAVIPGGLTSVLQPLDVGLNKPFKDRLKQGWLRDSCGRGPAVIGLAPFHMCLRGWPAMG